MLKSELITISTLNHKPEHFEKISNFVRFKIRHTEYVRITSSKQWKDYQNRLEIANAGAEIMTLDMESITKTLAPEEVADFVAKRDDLANIQAELDTYGIKIEDYNALSDTDKVFIILQAHTALKSIKLDKSIVEGIDLKKMIANFYAKGSMKDVKSALKTIFHNTCGKEGELFYGAKVRNSDFSDADVRNFLAYFRGNAARAVTKEEGAMSLSEYKWVCKEGSLDAQTMALTNLFAVVLDTKTGFEVIKPDETVTE